MTDPFLLDQKEVEVTLRRLEDAVNVRREMQKEKGSDFSDSLEYEFQGVESTIRNGIRDVKWSLDDLEETLKLMSENRGHFIGTEDLMARRRFLESARKTLADIEFEVSSPPLHAVINQHMQQTGVNSAVANLVDTDPPQAARLGQSEEAGELLRAGSEEQVVFVRSMIPHQVEQHEKHQPKQKHQHHQQQLVESMVSLNLDTVRDLIEPPGYRRSVKSLINGMIRYRCWLFLALLILFFFILIIVKAASRAHLSQAATTTMPTTECPWDNFNCI